MCGIAGIFSRQRVDETAIARLIAPISHRGPDDDGIWIDADAGIGLGHRRLAIVDLSPAGHQPMHSADGRFVLSFNGEIYNYQELKRDLEARGKAPAWRGHSDTEVFLHAIVTWGLEETLRRSAGMFAFALWDRRDRMLSLVRDRFGEKPLYYGWAGRDFVFGSELKALKAHPGFDNAIDRRALSLFASRSYVPAPLSIYERVFKLLPGCVLTVDLESAACPLDEPPEVGSNRNGLRLMRYWSYRDVVRSGLDQPIRDEGAALEQLENVLATAIRGQSLADVPVGAFLSGGIDSSTVCALYQKYSETPVRTFTIGFEDAGYNEAEDAKRVAEHLGTIHQEHYLTVREARDVIPLLPSMYDEPFADPSQIPTHLVSRFAREQVTVALTGDGGDELFAGYNRHFAAPELWEALRRIPRPLRAATALPLGRIPSQFWAGLGRVVPGRHPPHLGSKMQKAFWLAGSAESFDDIYRGFLDEWSWEGSPVLGGESAALGFDLDVGEGASDAVRTMYCDAVSYLPDDILAKVDRASMAVSLETRVPFLDHRVAEVAARIPIGMKVRDGRGKHLLRKLLYDIVPRELVDRPKAGFALPVGEWIKGPLRAWADDLLDQDLIRSQGWFDPSKIESRWRSHLSGKRDSSAAIWGLLMFQSWLQEHDRPASDARPLAGALEPLA